MGAIIWALFVWNPSSHFMQPIAAFYSEAACARALPLYRNITPGMAPTCGAIPMARSKP